MSEAHEIVFAQRKRRLARVVAAVVTASTVVCLAALVRIAIAHADPATDAVGVTAAPVAVSAPAPAPIAEPLPAATWADAGAAPAHPKKQHPKPRAVRGPAR